LAKFADISFKFNSDIKFLHLTDVSLDSGGPLPGLLCFLSNIGKSNRVEEIKLEVDVLGCGDDGPMDWSAWEEVDCILAGARVWHR
jgi:hypothetical protein